MIWVESAHCIAPLFTVDRHPSMLQLILKTFLWQLVLSKLVIRDSVTEIVVNKTKSFKETWSLVLRLSLVIGHGLLKVIGLWKGQRVYEQATQSKKTNTSLVHFACNYFSSHCYTSVPTINYYFCFYCFDDFFTQRLSPITRHTQCQYGPQTSSYRSI